MIFLKILTTLVPVATIDPMRIALLLLFTVMGANLINHTVETATRLQIQQVQRLHQINAQI